MKTNLLILQMMLSLIAFSRIGAQERGILNAAFLCVNGVYNSEFMAPYDIFHHTIFRDSSNYIRPFVVTPDGEPFVTFEGIRVTPHYAFATAPAADILVIPSTATSMNADLANSTYMDWVKKTVASASHVLTVCDGAFPLAATGVLNGRVATTFPGDRDAFAYMFPEVTVRYDVSFVADGKFITSVGGARSFEPALYLLEHLYSAENAKKTAAGLVLDWNLQRIPHLIVPSN